jgi:hypothetical protein
MKKPKPVRPRTGWVLVIDGKIDPMLWGTRRKAAFWASEIMNPAAERTTIRRATLTLDPVPPRRPK